MDGYKEILISPLELKSCSTLEKKIVIQKTTDILLTGKIVDTFNHPIAKAIISIKQINNCWYPPLIKDYGYLITNANGEYAVLLPCSCEIDYMLDVYQPMIKC